MSWIDEKNWQFIPVDPSWASSELSKKIYEVNAGIAHQQPVIAPPLYQPKFQAPIVALRPSQYLPPPIIRVPHTTSTFQDIVAVLTLGMLGSAGCGGETASDCISTATGQKVDCDKLNEDEDHDGVVGEDDYCPDKPGPATNDGCPEDHVDMDTTDTSTDTTEPDTTDPTDTNPIDTGPDVPETTVNLPQVDDDGDGFCEDPNVCSDGSEPGDCDDTSENVCPTARQSWSESKVDDDCNKKLEIQNKDVVTVTGEAVGSAFGHIAISGDLDGDGHAEAIFIAPAYSTWASGETDISNGRAYIFWGSEYGIPKLFNAENPTASSADNMITGGKNAIRGYRLGGNAFATDATGDGKSELFLSAEYALGPNGEHGAIPVFLGAKKDLWRALTDLHGVNIWNSQVLEGQNMMMIAGPKNAPTGASTELEMGSEWRLATGSPFDGAPVLIAGHKDPDDHAHSVTDIIPLPLKGKALGTIFDYNGLSLPIKTTGDGMMRYKGGVDASDAGILIGNLHLNPVNEDNVLFIRKKDDSSSAFAAKLKNLNIDSLPSSGLNYIKFVCGSNDGAVGTTVSFFDSNKDGKADYLVLSDGNISTTDGNNHYLSMLYIMPLDKLENVPSGTTINLTSDFYTKGGYSIGGFTRGLGYEFTTADMNGDGLREFVVGDGGGSPVSFLLLNLEKYIQPGLYSSAPENVSNTLPLFLEGYAINADNDLNNDQSTEFLIGNSQANNATGEVSIVHGNYKKSF